MYKIKVYSAVLVMMFAILTASSAQTIPTGSQVDEAKWIAVLKSDASRQAKSEACRFLAVYGTRASVPVLAGLLADPELSHMARYAMEPIPGPEVDSVLRDALSRLEGMPLVGVIGSIGVRRDRQAVPALAKMVNHTDPLVSQAAARALGTIGNAPAAEALQSALADAKEIQLLHVGEGLLRCAERLHASGEQKRAMAIYDQLRQFEVPHQVRSGAIRGAILSRGKDGLVLLQEYLHDEDYHRFSAAVQTAQEMSDPGVTQLLTKALDKLDSDHKILTIWALGKRADKAAVPTLLGLAKEGEKAVRQEAIQTLPQIPDASTIPVLVALLDDSDREIAQTAQESLCSLPLPEVDTAVMKMFQGGQSDKRTKAMEMITRRRMTQAIPALFQAAGGKDAAVRPAAIRMIGELGSSDQLPSLLELLNKLGQSQDLNAIEQAIRAVCADAETRPSNVERIAKAAEQAEPTQKVVLLRVLRALGGEKALQSVRDAMKDTNTEVSTTAFRSLCSWETPDAAQDLLNLAKSRSEATERLAALRGYIRLIRDKGLSSRDKLAMCRQASGLVERDDEKRLLLGALGTINSPAAVAMIAPYLDSQATRQEAAAACLAVSEELLKGQNAASVASRLVEPLEKTVGATEGDIANRAKALLEDAKKKAGR
ncbi:MAG: HEAT repeat domain-containing protein [Sedimentisphaerales bacterium]|nr:HEAT repeat domain-containing protein [Sedimentisphaerales bacterium]